MNHVEGAKELLARSSPRPKLLIVSSYRRPCGIAQYLEFLEGPLRDRAPGEVEITPLPVDLLRGSTSFARRAAAAEFDVIVAKARTADVVNIQLEPGLFGVTPIAIWGRLRRLLKAGRRVIITYHTAPPVAERISFGIHAAKAYLSLLRGQFVFSRLFALVRRQPGKFHHIVHTRREAQQLQLLGLPAASITALPLSFIDKDKRAAVDRQSARTRLLERWQLTADAKIVGTFGFLSEYKGIEVAVRALRHLPPNHHLIIVGGLHPEGIALRTVDQPYIRRLLAEIATDGGGELARTTRANWGSDLARAAAAAVPRMGMRSQESIADRVHFCGAPSNDEFNELLAACDAVVLPYAEVGQTSSGPAALALDMQLPLVCSRTNCFRELDRFQPGALSFFEIGNHLELAQRVLLDDARRPERTEARSNFVQKYNVEARATAYVTALMRLAMAAA